MSEENKPRFPSDAEVQRRIDERTARLREDDRLGQSPAYPGPCQHHAVRDIHVGMTVRQRIASDMAAALLASCTHDFYHAELAADAVMYADALIAREYETRKAHEEEETNNE